MTSAGTRKGQYRRKTSLIPYIMAIGIAAVLALLICLGLTALPASAEAKDPGTKYYKSIVIDQGDSLWNIAEEEMTNGWNDVRDYITEVKQINGLSGDTIHAGNHLIVPYYAS